MSHLNGVLWSSQSEEYSALPWCAFVIRLLTHSICWNLTATTATTTTFYYYTLQSFSRDKYCWGMCLCVCLSSRQWKIGHFPPTHRIWRLMHISVYTFLSILPAVLFDCLPISFNPVCPFSFFSIFSVRLLPSLFKVFGVWVRCVQCETKIVAVSLAASLLVHSFYFSLFFSSSITTEFSFSSFPLFSQKQSRWLCCLCCPVKSAIFVEMFLLLLLLCCSRHIAASISHLCISICTVFFATVQEYTLAYSVFSVLTVSKHFSSFPLSKLLLRLLNGF